MQMVDLALCPVNTHNVTASHLRSADTHSTLHPNMSCSQVQCLREQGEKIMTTQICKALHIEAAGTWKKGCLRNSEQADTKHCGVTTENVQVHKDN